MPLPEAVCVYCGASPGQDPNRMREAAELGRLIAESGLRLVYGGGGLGLMGAVARAALAAGGHVTGIIPDFLADRERLLAEVTDLQIVADMHERKARMMQQSGAFIILPGGFGTLEEFFEVLTWRQLGLHDKPILLVDPDGAWQPLIQLLHQVVTRGFARPEALDAVTIAPDVASVLPLLARLPAPAHPDQPERI